MYLNLEVVSLIKVTKVIFSQILKQVKQTPCIKQYLLV